MRIGGALYLDHRIMGIYGMLEGRSMAIDKAGSRFVPLPEFTRPGAIQAVLDDPEDFMIGAHASFMLAGQCWGVYSVRPSADSATATRHESLYIAPLHLDDRYTIIGPPQLCLAPGGSGALDEA